MAERSSSEPGFTAETMPTGIPISSQIAAEPIVSAAVTGSRL
jgi:hypothetical protein